MAHQVHSLTFIATLSGLMLPQGYEADHLSYPTRLTRKPYHHHHRHHHHQSLNREDRWGTTDDFATNFLHFSLFSTALLDLPNSRPVHSLMFSPHLFLCLPCLLPPFTVPCKMVLTGPDERETLPYHRSLRLFTMVRRSSCGPIGSASAHNSTMTDFTIANTVDPEILALDLEVHV